jgi:hypothetical protein
MKLSTLTLLLLISFAAGSYFEAVWRPYLFPTRSIAAN